MTEADKEPTRKLSELFCDPSCGLHTHAPSVTRITAII